MRSFFRVWTSRYILVALPVILALMGLAGCSVATPAVMIPEPNPAAAQTAAPPISTLALAISLPTTFIEENLETSTPQILGQIEQRQMGIRIHGDVRRDGPVRVAVVRQNTIRLEVPVAFAVMADILFNPTVSGELTLLADAELTITESWEPAVEVSTTYSWSSVPTLRLLTLDIPVQNLVDDMLAGQLATLERELEAQVVTQVDLKQPITALWTELQQVTALSTTPPIWLAVSPHAIRLGPIAGDAQSLSTTVALDLAAAVHVGPQPPQAAAMALPPPQTDAQIEPGFVLHLPVTVDYGLVEEQLSALMDAQMRALDTGSVALQVDGVELYPSGELLVVAAQLTVGLAPGTAQSVSVYLWGIPEIDLESMQLTMAEVGMASQGIGGLLALPVPLPADDLIGAVEASLASTLEATTVDLAPILAGYVEQIDGLLNQEIGPGQRLQGRLTRLAVDEIRMGATEMVVLLRAEGEIGVVLDGE